MHQCLPPVSISVGKSLSHCHGWQRAAVRGWSVYGRCEGRHGLFHIQTPGCCLFEQRIEFRPTWLLWICPPRHLQWSYKRHNADPLTVPLTVPLAVVFALTVALTQMYRVSNRCTRVTWMGVPFTSHRPPDGRRHGLVDHRLCRLLVPEWWLSGCSWRCGMRYLGYLRHRRICADFHPVSTVAVTCVTGNARLPHRAPIPCSCKALPPHHASTLS
jgi:hypothetical protein